jgi:peptidyl-prolyl cis-trans isomerase D
MLAIFRKNQQILMLIVAIIVIVTFVWFYNPTSKFNKFGKNDVFEIYGRVVQQAEVDREARAYGLSLGLGLTEFVKDLGGLGGDEQASLSDFILNVLIIRHAAPELGVRPSDEDVASVIRGLAPFQTDGNFDPAKYASFLQEKLAPGGFTERQLEEIVRDSIRTSALRRIVVSPVAAGEAQARDAARIYQPVTAQVMRFDSDAYAKSAEAKPEEVSAFYERNKQGLVSPERRDVSWVVFELPADQAKLEGKDRANALQQLADRADHAAKSIASELGKGVGFSKAAASFQPQKAQGIDREGTASGKDAGLPEAVVTGAFRLQKQGVPSDLIQDGNRFYLVAVEGVSPARQLALDEVSEKIATLIRRQKASKAAADAAAKSLDQISAAIKSGKSFAEAVKTAGVKTDQIGPVVPTDSKQSPEQQAFVSATLGLKEGELGSLQPAPFGAFAVYVQKREPLTEAQWKQHGPNLEKSILANERDILFQEWLRANRAASQLKILAGGRRG